MEAELHRLFSKPMHPAALFDLLQQEIAKNRASESLSTDAKRANVHALVSKLAHQIVTYLPVPKDSATQWKERIGRDDKAVRANVVARKVEFFKMIASEPPRGVLEFWSVSDSKTMLDYVLTFLDKRAGTVPLVRAVEAATKLQHYLIYNLIGIDKHLIRFAPLDPASDDELTTYAQAWRRNLLWREQRGQNYEIMDVNMRLASLQGAAKKIVQNARRPTASIIIEQMPGGAYGSSLCLAQDSECHVLIVGDNTAREIRLESIIEWRTQVDSARMLEFPDARREGLNDLSFPIVQVHRLASPQVEDTPDLRLVSLWTPTFIIARLAAGALTMDKYLDVAEYVKREKYFEKAGSWKANVEAGLLALLTALLNQLAACLYADLDS